jgi:transposase
MKATSGHFRGAIDLRQPFSLTARNQVERLFNRSNKSRRVATRYDRLAAN